MSQGDIQNVSKGLVVCNPPYIRVGLECCLDRDNNSICDRDEDPVPGQPASPAATAQIATPSPAITPTPSPPTVAAPSVTSYSLTPDLTAYGPDVQVQVRMQLAGGQSQAYKLVLASELVFRDWDITVDQQRTRGSGGDLQSPIEVEVPAEASVVKVSLNGSTPSLAVRQPKVLFRADWKDADGKLTELKTDRRDVGQGSVASAPVSTPPQASTATARIVRLDTDPCKSWDPCEIRVKAGTTVVWTNDDAVAHDVTFISGPETPKSGAPGTLAPGQSWSYKFERTGTYEFHCAIHHPLMHKPGVSPKLIVE